MVSMVFSGEWKRLVSNGENVQAQPRTLHYPPFPNAVGSIPASNQRTWAEWRFVTSDQGNAQLKLGTWWPRSCVHEFSSLVTGPFANAHQL